ncbi:hypothetical protein NUU61_004879 [Penicillium alfredii]|uniref:Uncharacterized protein n=1 Tax=Penicillium alfredii TaxID=1506179 RepID=A0A9W9F8E4_9EURO|nr:uncharacterized protein NUU61_004879 [Penicillium alfredii]KAJ5095523.1 hypothetical protein NUU61_004879 [Penicillium alfredii]
MERHLCPGRILHSGRRPISSRPSLLLCRSASWTHRPVTITCYPNENQFLLSYNSRPLPPFDPRFKENPDDWMPALLRCVPPSRIKPTNNPGPIEQHKDDFDRSHILMELQSLARKYRKVDLLSYLGFKRKQWTTVHALLNSLIDNYQLLVPLMPPRQPLMGLDWNIEGASLNHLTSKHNRLQRLSPKPLKSDLASLDDLTLRPTAQNLAQRHLAEILQSLGSIILAAADHPPNESKIAMSYVFRVLARLHHAGMISDRVYKYPRADPSELSFRPPGLHLLSTHIMSVLSDAAWLEHEAAVAAAAAEAGEKSPYLPFKMGIRELGPEIWFEFILWCCVEHGFTKQGAWLAWKMTKRGSKRAWKTESWAPLVPVLDIVQQTNISNEQSWRRPGKNPPRLSNSRDKPPFNGLGTRTISTEVVVSLRDGLTNKAYNGVGNRGYSPATLLKMSAPLNSLINSPVSDTELRPTHRTTNWHVVRVLESGCLLPKSDPHSLERVLRSHENLAPPWEGRELVTEEQLSEMTRAQLYDETAAMVGLLEYNIKCHTWQQQSGRAFQEYAWLQSVVDASKERHIEAFFHHLGRSDSQNIQFFDSQQLGLPSLDQSSLPQVSNVTFAELLDLATTSHAFGFGKSLLFSNDVDGPAIPRSAYGDQSLAPSILRFAAATQNPELCNEVINSLSTPLSLYTMKTLVNLHIAMRNWDRVIFTLNYLRDHRIKSWGFDNVTALAAVIIKLDASVQHKRASGISTDESEIRDLESAKDILLRIFHGEFSTPTGKHRGVRLFQQKALLRLHRVFLSIPGCLPGLIKHVKLNFPVAKRQKLFYVPPESFYLLLAAVVDSYGSIAGKRLWEKWCLEPPSPQRLRQQDGGVERLLLAMERNNNQGDPSFNPEWFVKIQKKAVLPTLNAVRIIAQAANKGIYRRTSQGAETEAEAAENHSGFKEARVFFFFLPSHPHRLHHHRPQIHFQIPNSSRRQPPASELEATLDFCVEMFLRLDLPHDQLDVEVPGHEKRLRLRHVFTHPLARDSRRAIQRVREDPWITSSGG